MHDTFFLATPPPRSTLSVRLYIPHSLSLVSPRSPVNGAASSCCLLIHDDRVCIPTYTGTLLPAEEKADLLSGPAIPSHPKRNFVGNQGVWPSSNRRRPSSSSAGSGRVDGPGRCSGRHVRSRRFFPDFNIRRGTCLIRILAVLNYSDQKESKAIFSAAVSCPTDSRIVTDQTERRRSAPHPVRSRQTKLFIGRYYNSQVYICSARKRSPFTCSRSHVQKAGSERSQRDRERKRERVGLDSSNRTEQFRWSSGLAFDDVNVSINRES